jgi:hypothetical protein
MRRPIPHLHLVRVNQDGDLTVDAAADWTSELRRFIECDHQGVRKRRLAASEGPTPPNRLNLQPAVELDSNGVGDRQT